MSTTIHLGNVPPEFVLAELFHGTQPVGLGAFAPQPERFDHVEARAFLGDRLEGDRIALDYVFGRPIKVTFVRNGDGSWDLERGMLYDRDAGEGACAKACQEAATAFRIASEAASSRG